MNEDFPHYPVAVTLFRQEQYEGGWIPENLTDAVAWLQGYLEQVPEEYRDKATIEITSQSDYDYHKPCIEISYHRPPTDQEKQDRLEDERQHSEAREARDRQEYYRLRAKFNV